MKNTVETKSPGKGVFTSWCGKSWNQWKLILEHIKTLLIPFTVHSSGDKSDIITTRYDFFFGECENLSLSFLLLLFWKFEWIIKPIFTILYDKDALFKCQI